MAWTSPRTWLSGEVVTAALLNTHLRDNLLAIGDPWTNYGSGASWTGASENPSLGNGTWDGRYIQAGRLITMSVQLTAGTTTTFGAGTYGIALPVPPATSTSRLPVDGTFYDSSTGDSYPIVGLIISGALSLRCLPVTAGNPLRNVTPAAPVTMDAGDVIALSGTYEGA